MDEYTHPRYRHTVFPRRNHRMEHDKQQFLGVSRRRGLVILSFALPLILPLCDLCSRLSFPALLHLSRRTNLLPADDVPPLVLQLLGQGVEVGFRALVARAHHGEDAVRGLGARGARHEVVLIAGVFGVEEDVHEEGGRFESVRVERGDY
jgi:hypothetical protein